MQQIDDLKEIFKATQDLGVAWQNELVELRAKNSRLIAENKLLADNFKKISEENKNLHAELNNLSEKVGQLMENLRGDILTELNARNSDDFQNFVKDYLKKIRDCVDGTLATEKPTENSIAEYNETPDVAENSPKYE